MNKYYTYYYLFYNKSKNYYIKSQYNKLTQEISRLKKLELKLFNDNNNGKEINDNDNNDEIIINNKEDNNNLSNINEAKQFLNSVKNFLLNSIKEINIFENNTLKIYYVSIQNYFSVKGLLISKKYKLLNEYEFFKKFNKEKEEHLNKQIINDKKHMSKAVINKTENKLFNYFNYESLTSKKMIKTLSTLGLLSLTIIGVLYLRKKYQKEKLLILYL